jgi:hypothetical protein
VLDSTDRAPAARLPARLGTRAGVAVVIVGGAYAAVLACGMVRHGLSEPIADPVLAVMELLTIASAVPILLLFVALRATTGAASRPSATLALGSAALFSLTTVGVHLFELTLGRRMGARGLVWPSTSYAIELFAWDLLLGVALILAAQSLRADASAARVRRWLALTGVLCIVGIIGPVIGNMRVQRVGVLGYAVLLPITAWRLAVWWRDGRRAPP